MSISEKIDNLLKDRNMSRRQLAIKAGISPSTLQSAMERGKNFSIEMLQKIAEALSLSFHEFYIYLFLDAPFEQAIEFMKITNNMYSALEIIAKDEHLPKATRELVKENLPNPAIFGALSSISVITSKHYETTVTTEIFNAFKKLNAHGKQVAVDRVEELTKIPEYQAKFE